MKKTLILLFLVSCFISVTAQVEPMNENDSQTDSIKYQYIPLQPSKESQRDSLLKTDSVPKRIPKTRFGRFIQRMGQPAPDKTFTKKIDVSIIGGPYYSKSTSVGIGILAAGLYRIDRTDRTIQPSNASLFGSVSVKGLYQLGVEGTNIFRGDRNRLNYLAYFMSLPTFRWGFGYNGGMNPEDAGVGFANKKYDITIKFLHRVHKNIFLGGSVELNYAYVGGSDNQKKNIHELLEREIDLGHISKLNYRSSVTGAGLTAIFEYDSRDVISNPFKGVYFSLQGTVRPNFMTNFGTTYRLKVILDYYQALWKGAILALDFYTEINSLNTPWMYFAELGGMYRMRGYYRSRFNDINATMVQAELRQRIWKRIGAVAWVGAGNVYRRFDKFNWSETLPNYGVGLRFEFKRRMNIRLDYGFGKRIHNKLTNSFIFSISEAF